MSWFYLDIFRDFMQLRRMQTNKPINLNKPIRANTDAIEEARWKKANEATTTKPGAYFSSLTVKPSISVKTI